MQYKKKTVMYSNKGFSIRMEKFGDIDHSTWNFPYI